MREHNHRRHPVPQQLRSQACELFVPRVKESRLCSVCGFTLIDHKVEPISYQPSPNISTTGSLRNHSSKSIGLQHSTSVDGALIGQHNIKEYKLFGGLLIPQNNFDNYSSGGNSPVYATMDSKLTPSFNSAFTRYERSPSKDSIAISDFSLSPVSLKNSPYLPPANYHQPKHSRSASITRMENLPLSTKIIKPKPLPMPRPYLKQQFNLAPTVEDDRENFSDDFEPQSSPQIFRRVRQKKREKINEKNGRKSLSPNPNPILLSNPKAFQNQDCVIRPQNFKEILNRFQTAASDTSTTVSPLNFQRHHSVRLPTTNQQNRRFTLGGEALLISTKNISINNSNTTMKSSILQPPPIIKLKTSTTNNLENNLIMTNPLSQSDIESEQETKNIIKISTIKEKQLQQPLPPKREKHYIQRRESDAYQAAINAKRTGLVGNFIEKNVNAKNNKFSDEDDVRSSPDEDKINQNGNIIVETPIVKKRQSKIENLNKGQYQATNVVAVRKPKPANRTNSNMGGAQRKLSNHSIHSNHSNASSLRNLKEIDENSNDKHFDEPSHHQLTFGSRPATAAEYISGGSDSGYARYPNSTETSSMESPRSPSQLLRSPNPIRTKATDELYGQMTIQHTNTLAFVVDNYSDVMSNFNEFSEYGRDLFEDLSVENIIFKSTTPLLVKEKLAVFDAVYVTPNYTEHRVTVMLAPTCQYAPLMGRIAERSGFGPTILAEIEEPEITFRHLLEESGIDFNQRSTVYKVMIMPPISLCSFHSLAVHNMHKAMNVQRYEHHVCFIMLQLLCALKVLQSDGVEHLSNNFKEFLLTYKATDLKNALENLQQLPKLMFLRETMEEDFDDHMSTHTSLSIDSSRVGVCRYALRALCTLLNHKMHNTIPDILDRTEYSRSLKKCAELLHLEKSSSLTEAKNLLEFTFFCGRTNFESEFDAKLWLDERRAHEVNRLVRLLADRAECLSESRERMYIQFLLSATPRTIYNTFRQYIKL